MKSLLLAFFSTLAFFSYAQTAPDFTATDIEGNEHSLYADYLDQGKVAIVDFSATWCSPCYFLHQLHVLEDIYKMMGPEGTDELTVLFIESDPSTTMADLEGTGPATLGNWIEGTSYPIIDEDSSAVADAYGVIGFPTIPFICSDGTFISSNLFQEGVPALQTESLATKAYECLPNSGLTNDLRVLGHKGDDSSCGLFTADIYVHNFGTTAASAGTEITILRNGTPFTSQTLSELPVASVNKIALENLSLDPALDSTVFTIVLPTDDNPDNNEYELVIQNESIATPLAFTINWPGDNYSSEDGNRFFIYDNNGAAVDSSEVIGSGDFSQEIVLPAEGCYRIEFIDGFSDGIADGSITITTTQNETVYQEETPVYSLLTRYINASEDFMVSTAGVDRPATHIEVFPSVTKGEVNAIVDLQENAVVEYAVLNTMGQIVNTTQAERMYQGRNSASIDLSDLDAGVYFVRFTLDGQVFTKKVVKE